MLLPTIAKFASVGVINTLIDFGIFNFLTGRRLAWPKISANLLSTTVAMSFSFLANKHFVFGATGGNKVQIIQFIAVTAAGLYILQNLVIFLLTQVWLGPSRLANWLVRSLGLRRLFTKDFVSRNTAKAAATAASLTWNFLLYKTVVFRT